MSPKINCVYCPPHCHKPRPAQDHRQSETHPSWSAGVEALEDFNHWVNAVLLPIAFQWIEEHKPEVYANVPDELRDDVGVAIAAAFNLVKEVPVYKQGLEQRDTYETARENGTWDSSKTNPVWTGIATKVRAQTHEAFAEHSEHLGDTIP
jgi:hypothetical protein